MRMRGHAEHDDARYVPGELFEEWRSRDPIALFEKVLRDRKLDPAAVDARVQEEIEEDAEFAENSPFPEPENAFGGVFANP